MEKEQKKNEKELEKEDREKVRYFGSSEKNKKILKNRIVK